MNKLIWGALIFLFIFRVGDFLVNSEKYNEGAIVRLEGRLLQEPTFYNYSQGFELNGVRVYVQSSKELHYGDYIEIEGTYKEGIVQKAKIIKHESHPSLFLSIRERILDIYKKSLPQDEAGLVAGITLGSKVLIDQEFWNAIKKSGTAHVVVASGTNIVLVSAFFIRFATLFMRRSKALFFSFLGIWSYTFLVGFEAPIIRASIMATTAFLFQWYGRVYKPLFVLTWVALWMIIIVPSWLVDVGFYLSFFATAGIMVLERPLESKLRFIPRFVRGDFATTLAAQIAVSPILLFFFGSIQWIAPFVNMLILWTIVPITITGFLSGLVGLFVPDLGGFILLGAYPFSWWFVFIVNVFG